MVGCTAEDPDGRATASSSGQTTGAAQGARVTVQDAPRSSPDDLDLRGEGFNPGLDFTVAPCSPDAQIGDPIADVCDMSRYGAAKSNKEGTFDTALTVTAVIATGKRQEVECPAVRCAIGVANIADMTVLTLTPLALAGDPEVSPAPVLRIEHIKLDDKTNTGTATVVGSGYVPLSKVNLVQCPAGRSGALVDPEDCLYEYGTNATADAKGELRVDIAAYPRFQRSSDELIKCLVTPSLCVIADPCPGDSGNRMSRVAFDSAPT